MKKSKSSYSSMTKSEKLIGWIYLAFQIVLPWLLQWLNGFLSQPLDVGTLRFVCYLLNFVGIICIFNQFLRNSLTAAWRDLWHFVQAVVLGFVFCWAAIWLLDWLLSFVISAYSPILDTAVSDLLHSSYALRLIGILILAPVIEETLYRGLVFRSIWRKSKVAGYLISILVYAAVHTLGHLGTADITTLALCFVRYLPAGLVLAWTYSKADNVFAPILVHAAINAVTIGIF